MKTTPGYARAPGRREAGLTLVELMIVVLLFAILSGGAIMAFTGQQQTTAGQQRANSALEAAQATLNALSFQVRMATAGARDGQAHVNLAANIPSGSTNCNGNGLVPTIEVTNSAAAPDSLRIVYPMGTAWGTVTGGAVGATRSDDVYAASTFVEMRVRSGASAPAISAGDWVLMSDFTAAVLFKATGITNPCASGSGEICIGKAASGTTYPNSYGFGSVVFRARWFDYSVNASPGPDWGMPVLSVRDLGQSTAEPAAAGIEDLQVALAFDLDNDGIDAESTGAADADEWVFNVAGETLTPTYATTACALTRLVAVRISLVARASQTDVGAVPRRPALEDRPAAAAADGYYRVVLRNVIALRNK